MTTKCHLSLSIDQLARIIRGDEQGVAGIHDDDAALNALVDALDTLDPGAMEKLVEATGGGVAASRAFAAALPDLMDQKDEATDVSPAIKTAADRRQVRRELESCDLFVKEFSFVREVFSNAWRTEIDCYKRNVITRTGDNPVVVYVKNNTARGVSSGWTVLCTRDWFDGIGCDGFGPFSAVRQMERRKMGIDIE